jgi:hypothetical protein
VQELHPLTLDFLQPGSGQRQEEVPETEGRCRIQDYRVEEGGGGGGGGKKKINSNY